MYTEKINAYIDAHKAEMLEDLKTLIRIDSQRAQEKEGMPFGEGPAKVLAAAGTMMSGYGLTVQNYDNYVVTGDFSDAPKVLDILAHLDVVPVTDEWTVTKPFEPLIKDNRIYGRGTCDDKGPAIAALYAIRAIRELGIPMKNSVRLILGSDEECGSSDLKYYYSKEKEAKYTFTPDADFPVINIEKARLAKPFTAKVTGETALVSFDAGDKVNVVPQNAYASLCGISKETIEQICRESEKEDQVVCRVSEEGALVHVHVRGCSAHAASPQNGNNALTAMLKIISKLSCEGDSALTALKELSVLFPHKDTCGEAMGIKMADEISGALTMNLGVLKLKEDTLTGEFDVRAPLCANDDNVTRVVKEQLEKHGWEMEDTVMKPAHHVPADSLLVRTLLECYEKFSGRKGKPLAIGGGTYVHNLKNGVAFGCASDDVDNHMHGDDEFMELDALTMSVRIFADAIIKLCNA